MRKQIAAANWKMNCTLPQAKDLLKKFSDESPELKESQEVILAVPFPYLLLAKEMLSGKEHYFIAAQNCYTKDFGAYTGEVSAAMLDSCRISHVILGHSERRQYFHETNAMLAEKTDEALKQNLVPVFCCGEDLEIREKGIQNDFVSNQIKESLFHLSDEQFSNIIIAYEPIWAIGTGKTASSEQAEEMHAHIRKTIAEKYGENIAGNTSILYGGSVKGDNASEIFAQPDVDGGLVGGASLKADEFFTIIKSLKNL